MDAFLVSQLILALFAPGVIGFPGLTCPSGTVAVLKPDAVQEKNARGEWRHPAIAYECMDNPPQPGRGRDIPNP